MLSTVCYIALMVLAMEKMKRAMRRGLRCRIPRVHCPLFPHPPHTQGVRRRDGVQEKRLVLMRFLLLLCLADIESSPPHQKETIISEADRYHEEEDFDTVERRRREKASSAVAVIVATHNIEEVRCVCMYVIGCTYVFPRTTYIRVCRYFNVRILVYVSVFVHYVGSACTKKIMYCRIMILQIRISARELFD